MPADRVELLVYDLCAPARVAGLVAAAGAGVAAGQPPLTRLLAHFPCHRGFTRDFNAVSALWYYFLYL